MRRYQALIAILLIALFITPTQACAEPLTIRIPEYTSGDHEYFHEILSSALSQAGHTAAIETIVDIPDLREREMLKAGDIDVLWLIRSKERDEQYLPIPVNLTNGLVGQRILLVSQAKKNNFKDINTLEDFRELGKIGGLGKDWFDVRVWAANDLPYREIVKWRLLYDMVADGTRNIDYFSRGFNEVVENAHDHPNLAIEPHLMLVYDRDFRFYVSPKAPHLVPILEDALLKLRDSGEMDKIIKKRWAKSYDIIKPDQRTILKLKNPE